MRRDAPNAKVIKLFLRRAISSMFNGSFGSIDGVSESCVDLYCLFYHSRRRLETEGTASGLARSLARQKREDGASMELHRHSD